MATIKDVAEEAEVSTATVSRVLNESNNVSPKTQEKVEQVIEKLDYSPGKSDQEKTSLTIKDVAESAGVSEATVSRVLNNNQNVAPKTRQKVKATIEQLGYTPNLNARGLRSNETKLIGLIIPDIANSFFAEIMKGVENLANSHGYNVVLLETDADLKRELECVKALQDRRADGIIYMGENIGNLREAALEESEVPTVVVCREEENKFPTVNIDNYQAVYEMMDYLIKEANYRQIGFISGPLNDITAGKLRFEAYRQALKDNNLVFNQDWVVETNFVLEEGYQAGQEIVANSQQPEVVFAASDELAVGAMQAIKEAGFAVPDDIGLVGFDNIELSRYVFPNLTTIGQPIYELGKTAAEMIIKLSQGEELTSQDVYLDYELIIRDSTWGNN